MAPEINSGLRGGGRVATSADDAIASAFSLYLSARAGARALDPRAPTASDDEQAADKATWASRSLAEQIVDTRARSIRCVVMKLALAVLESDTGEGTSEDADLQTRLTASAMRDAVALTGDAVLAQGLSRLRIF